MNDPLEAALLSMRMGDMDGAREELMQALRLDPRNAEAWELLAEAMDEPHKKMDCYRQVLRFDPSNRNAAQRLAELSGQGKPPQPANTVPPSAGVAPPALPLSLAERARIGSAASSPQVLPAQQPILPAEIYQLMDLLRENGPEILDEHTINKFKSQGIDIAVTDEGVTIASEFRKVTVYPHEMRSLKGNLSWNQIITQSSRGLSADERSNCPKCQAVISTHDTRYSWCGAVLAEERAAPATDAAPKPVERRRCPKCDAVVEPQAVRCPWCSSPL